jgi:hypothetical protein
MRCLLFACVLAAVAGIRSLRVRPSPIHLALSSNRFQEERQFTRVVSIENDSASIEDAEDSFADIDAESGGHFKATGCSKKPLSASAFSKNWEAKSEFTVSLSSNVPKLRWPTGKGDDMKGVRILTKASTKECGGMKGATLCLQVAERASAPTESSMLYLHCDKDETNTQLKDQIGLMFALQRSGYDSYKEWLAVSSAFTPITKADALLSIGDLAHGYWTGPSTAAKPGDAKKPATPPSGSKPASAPPGKSTPAPALDHSASGPFCVAALAGVQTLNIGAMIGTLGLSALLKANSPTNDASAAASDSVFPPNDPRLEIAKTVILARVSGDDPKAKNPTKDAVNDFFTAIQDPKREAVAFCKKLNTWLTSSSSPLQMGLSDTSKGIFTSACSATALKGPAVVQLITKSVVEKGWLAQKINPSQDLSLAEVKKNCGSYIDFPVVKKDAKPVIGKVVKKPADKPKTPDASPSPPAALTLADVVKKQGWDSEAQWKSVSPAFQAVTKPGTSISIAQIAGNSFKVAATKAGGVADKAVTGPFCLSTTIAIKQGQVKPLLGVLALTSMLQAEPAGAKGPAFLALDSMLQSESAGGPAPISPGARSIGPTPQAATGAADSALPPTDPRIAIAKALVLSATKNDKDAVALFALLTDPAARADPAAYCNKIKGLVFTSAKASPFWLGVADDDAVVKAPALGPPLKGICPTGQGTDKTVHALNLRKFIHTLILSEKRASGSTPAPWFSTLVDPAKDLAYKDVKDNCGAYIDIAPAAPAAAPGAPAPADSKTAPGSTPAKPQEQPKKEETKQAPTGTAPTTAEKKGATTSTAPITADKKEAPKTTAPSTTQAAKAKDTTTASTASSTDKDKDKGKEKDTFIDLTKDDEDEHVVAHK